MGTGMNWFHKAQVGWGERTREPKSAQNPKVRSSSVASPHLVKPLVGIGVLPAAYRSVLSAVLRFLRFLLWKIRCLSSSGSSTGLVFPPHRQGPKLWPVLMDAPDTIPTRWSLIKRLKDWDDQESWREFFDTYWRLIYATAVRAGLSDVEAQEVVQETVITVARQMKGFQADPERGSFKSWLLHTTRWKIADQFAKRQAVPAHEPRSSDTGTGSGERRTATVDRIPDPAGQQLEKCWDEEWEQHVRTAALRRVKSRVDPLQYQIFDLCVLRGAGPKKVAAKLGVKLWRVYFARNRVAQLVKRELKKLEEG
jgi:RNA polymerase sigma-70 factor (ECF subfamily)